MVHQTSLKPKIAKPLLLLEGLHRFEEGFGSFFCQKFSYRFAVRIFLFVKLVDFIPFIMRR